MVKKNKLLKLGLGTVQFGMKYGISNSEGQTSKQEVRRILEVARRKGIRYLDTASQYGRSEQVLGQTMPVGHQFRIITKTPHFKSKKIEQRHISQLKKSFEQSLDRLLVDSVYGLMVHNAEDLLVPGGENLYQAIIDLKKDGKLRKAGVSVYTAKQIDMINSRYDIDIIQVPVNILDQRLIQSGHLSDLKKRGVEIHARSIFLQGLLLMRPDELHSYFDPIKRHIQTYQNEIHSHGFSLLSSAVQFVKSIDLIDKVLVGVDSVVHLQEISAAYNVSIQKSQQIDFLKYAVDHSDFVDPSQWKI
ncbi:MAG: aldo/keto reductase [Candidatus Electrothrix sp. GW3-4]|uniref:aldo/keto reductase n=1 Tax=Candidatus Electrothrix sp. GW3-4 TaxID=3126740 RepID=UPI0030CD5858